MAKVRSALSETHPVAEIWDVLAALPRLGTVAEVHRGLAYKVPMRDSSVPLVADRPAPGFAPGLYRVTKGFEPYIITGFQFLNMDPNLLRDDARQVVWDQPKVIVTTARLTPGPWRLTAGMDERGLVFSQQFAGLWAAELPLEVLAALLNGLVANACITTDAHAGDHPAETMGRLPIPQFTASQLQSLVALVRQYRFYREQWLAHAHLAQRAEEACQAIMARIDDDLLAAYALPPALDRALHAHFAGHPRPGPVHLDQTPAPPIPSRSLYGLWADLGPAPSEEEIDAARREAWAGFAQTDPL